VVVVLSFAAEAVVHFENSANERPGDVWHRRPLTLSLSRPTSIAWADLDADGFLDLVRGRRGGCLLF